jgi:hypothetical protein
MRRRKRFETIELDQIKHLIEQTDEDESDDAGTAAASKPVTAADRSRPITSAQANTKGGRARKRV